MSLRSWSDLEAWLAKVDSVLAAWEQTKREIEENT